MRDILIAIAPDVNFDTINLLNLDAKENICLNLLNIFWVLYICFYIVKILFLDEISIVVSILFTEIVKVVLCNPIFLYNSIII